MLNAALSALLTLTFGGSTPCGEEARRFLGIANDACQQITWDLALTQADTGDAFDLRVRYHMPIPGSPNHLDEGRPLRIGGTWTVAPRAGAGAGQTIYTLTSNGRALRFALLERDLLHLLTSDDRLTVGNAGWSYTLNRREGQAERTPRRMVRLDVVPTGMGGVFEGRTPCQAIAPELNLTVDAGCTKLKWKITLFQDGAPGGPATYKQEGTLYRDGRLQGAPPRTGTWRVMRDQASGALVYRLEPDSPGPQMLLLRADENILFFLDGKGAALVGDMSFSYTLNRIRR